MSGDHRVCRVCGDDMCSDRQHWEATERIERLEAVVEKLPKTADGVRFRPYLIVWYDHGTGELRRYVLTGINGYETVYFEGGFSSMWDWNRAYSTPTAAREAGEGGKG